MPADPMCRAEQLYTETPPTAAACLIKSQLQLLAIKNHDEDGWSLPYLKMQASMTGQCTAHSAVWKATGLNVKVGQLLFTGADHTQYFACELTDDFSKNLNEFPVPSWATRKTKQINLVDPFETQQSHWESYINLIEVREAFTKLK